MGTMKGSDMAEFAPLFEGNVLPKNTTPLTDRTTTNELVAETVGAAPGAAASATRARVQHSQQGDTQKIETVSHINRNTTAADVTAVETKFTKKKPSFTFARDLSGNGGPAFTRT